jgi:hypothetical protein
VFLVSGQPTIHLLKNFKLSLRILLHVWGHHVSWMWHHVTGCVALALQMIVTPSSSGKSSPSRKILFLTALTLKMKEPWSFELSAMTHTTQHQTPRHLNPEQHHYENLKSWIPHSLPVLIKYS